IKGYNCPDENNLFASGVEHYFKSAVRGQISGGRIEGKRNSARNRRVCRCTGNRRCISGISTAATSTVNLGIDGIYGHFSTTAFNNLYIGGDKLQSGGRIGGKGADIK